eukprot:Gb_02551 [translate_table: standard]
MAIEGDIFQLSGPRHLSSIDWCDSNHRRCIAASLVQGVYVQERDRQDHRQGAGQALADMWWSFFKFKLKEVLLDRIDGSIFGSVYKFSKKAAGLQSRPPGVPKMVVAFRGTVTTPDSFARDLELDLELLRNGLHKTCRYEMGLDAVRRSVSKHGSEHGWIAGHSLGAAMAMLVGRKMAEEGYFLEAYLFNPPFFSAPLERIKNQKLKRGLHVALSMVTAGLALTLRDECSRMEAQNAFAVLRAWVPWLFVNPKDDVCSAYLGYFANRRRMHEMGAGNIANLAAQHSITDIILCAFGKESKPLHLIPSARLSVSLSPSAPDFKRAHGIHQWWAPNLVLHCTDCRLELSDRLK